MIKKEFDVEVAKNLYLSSFDKKVISIAKKAVINEIKRLAKEKIGAMLFRDENFIKICEDYYEEIYDNQYYYNEYLENEYTNHTGKYKKIILDWLKELGFEISEYYSGNRGVKGPYIIWYTEEFFL